MIMETGEMEDNDGYEGEYQESWKNPARSDSDPSSLPGTMKSLWRQGQRQYSWSRQHTACKVQSRLFKKNMIKVAHFSGYQIMYLGKNDQCKKKSDLFDIIRNFATLLKICIENGKIYSPKNCKIFK